MLLNVAMEREMEVEVEVEVEVKQNGRLYRRDLIYMYVTHQMHMALPSGIPLYPPTFYPCILACVVPPKAGMLNGNAFGGRRGKTNMEHSGCSGSCGLK